MGLYNTSPPSAKIAWPPTSRARGDVATVRDLQPPFGQAAKGSVMALRT